MDGELSTILVEKGYLAGGGDRWLDKSPPYYIEVKTTPDSCGKQFYMTDGQYARVNRLS